MRTPTQALCLLAPLLLTSQAVLASPSFEAVHINYDGSVEELPVVRTNSAPVQAAAGKSPVPVEMFVMSKCPDAKDCVANLVVPVMSRLFESGKMILKPTYIGTPDDSTGGIACMHGPGECLGNILELCAYEKFKADPKKWLGFTNCMSQDYRNIPDTTLMENCAREYGMDPKVLSDCAASTESKEGVELLRTSARRAMSLKVKTSCTLQVMGKTVCVRDGGEWKEGCNGNVDEMVKLIEEQYNKQ
ncbi:hypothetical protein TWF696_002258 [Orbilia brochopaga]|uniref:Uncharacterized protein n=1 Tax=Orbilia brochopaga TaxID=3140254 RepID=A0AAV9U517_9PEZI